MIEVGGSSSDEDEIVNELTNALANSLGVHVKDVEVSYNATSGEATFTVLSSNYDDLENLQNTISEPGFVNVVNSNIEDLVLVNADAITVSDEIVATVDMTVDLTKSPIRPFISDASDSVQGNFFCFYLKLFVRRKWANQSLNGS